jgi:hypothetical protein
MAGAPPGFNADAVIKGLHDAMIFGKHPDPTMAPMFLIPTSQPTIGAVHDEEGIPYHPGTVRAEIEFTEIQVPCAVRYVANEPTVSEGDYEPLGVAVAAGIWVLLLEEDYQQVAGFQFVRIKNDIFQYVHEQPPIALGTVGVRQIRCNTVDES